MCRHSGKFAGAIAEANLSGIQSDLPKALNFK
jgi:hypothetical protein